MFKLVSSVVIATCLFTALAGCSEQKETNTGTISSAPVTQTSQPEAQVVFSKTFTGSIDSKYGITMKLTRKGNELTGTYFYNKVKQPITISGKINADGTLLLEEKDTKGTVTGKFEGTLFADSELTGQWSKPESNKSLPFSVKETSSTNSVAGVEVTEYSFSVQGTDNQIASYTFPKVQGNIDPAILTKINQQLSVQNLTEETEEDIKQNYAECSCGLVNSSYVVNYNKHGMLSITVLNEWLGAYPSSSTKHININTQTGELLTIEQLLNPTSLTELAAMADSLLQERITESKKDAADAGEAEWANELLAGKKFEKADLQNFTVDENGLTFYYSFGFPHVAMALEPDGIIGFTYEQLQNFIDPTGWLAVEKR